MLGDRLLLARILLKALDAKELDEEQCERLFGLTPEPGPTKVLYPDGWRDMPALDQDIQADVDRSLASVDNQERQEALAAITPSEMTSIPPIDPVAPGQNLLEDPEDFVAKVARRRSRQMGR